MIKKIIIPLFILIFLISLNSFAGNLKSGEISWFFIIIGLLGGLSIFLYGMNKMSSGLKKSAGNGMRHLLASLTGNRFLGFAVGAIVTMVIQSSSATTVMLISFVQSGLISYLQTLGVILGAKIGTTITAQLIAFNISDYALILIVLGFGMSIFPKKDKYKIIGDTVLGFGMLFYGMKLMSSSMEPLQHYQGFVEVLQNLENPFAGIFIGIIFTALIQSSSAFTGILIVLAQQNLITLDAAIPMIFGSTIGASVITAVSCIGTTNEAKRVALSHVLFSVIGALIFAFWIPYFSVFIKWIAQYFGSSPERQIANAHTVFHVGIVLIFMPILGFWAKLMIKILPASKAKENYLTLKYIDKKALNTPIPAIDLAVAEVARTADILSKMLETIIQPFIGKEVPKDKYHPELSHIQALEMREEEINFLQKEISDYLYQIARSGIPKARIKEVFGLISVVKDIENIADVIYVNMQQLIEPKQQLNSDFSEKGKEEIISYHILISKQLSRLKNVFEKRDSIGAVKILVKGEKYSEMELKFRRSHYLRMKNGKEESLITDHVHSELFDSLKQIGIYLENIAKTIAETSSFKYRDEE